VGMILRSLAPSAADCGPGSEHATERVPSASCTEHESALVGMALAAAALPAIEVGRRARRAERRDVDTAAAVVAALGGIPLAAHGDALHRSATLARLLGDSSISTAQAEKLLDLFPQQKPGILSLPADELYIWLWSILGNDFVRDLLDD